MHDRFRPVGHCLKALIAAAAVLAACGLSEAQTAPQLLPYTSKLIAGGGAQSIAKGATCPSSGFTSTDAYGDGCLATEVQFTSTGATSTKPFGARYALADATGAIFFSDATAGLVRRIDPTTGIVAAFAGGAAASPASGTACGAYTSIDARGDACLSTAVHLTYPMGLAIAANGDLIFTDVGQYDVRRVAAVNGVLQAAGGIITNIAGYAGGSATFGYVVSNASTSINAATQSYLDAPYNVALDSQGDIIIAEEFKNAVVVVNPGATATTVAGVTVAPGTIIKIAGEALAATYVGTPYCPNGTSGTFGCSFNPFVDNAPANITYLDSPYAVAVDPGGNIYIANEFTNVVPRVSPSGVLTTYAGKQTGGTKTTARGVAPFSMGSPFGIVADPYSNLYFTDALSGVIWRVDAAGQYQYVVAGGASSTCSGATDAYGDGCPATQATFGSSSGSSANTYALAANPGIFGITIDAAGNLYVGDTITNLIREVSTNTQFGGVGGSAVTQALDIHFAANDTPASNAYTLTQATANFTLDAATCTLNSDKTTDCLLPVTATSATSANLGNFSATLKVTSAAGGTNTFTLTGTHVQSPATRTAVSTVASSNCTGTSVFSISTPIKITATITSTGSPSGTVQFSANGVVIGSPVAVSNGSASLTYTFTAANTYAITAAYSGDSYFNASQGSSGATITTTAPTFSTTMVEFPLGNTIVQGQTAAYSFNIAQSVYSGTITFSASGLPPNSSVVFSPASVSATGCSTSNVVTMSLNTQLATVKQASLVGGPWRLLLTLFAVALASMMLVRRRTLRGPWSRVALMFTLLVASTGLLACGNGAQSGVSTPAGTYTVSVKATGSDGTSSTVNTTLTITAYQAPYK